MTDPNHIIPAEDEDALRVAWAASIRKRPKRPDTKVWPKIQSAFDRHDELTTADIARKIGMQAADVGKRLSGYSRLGYIEAEYFQGLAIWRLSKGEA